MTQKPQLSKQKPFNHPSFINEDPEKSFIFISTSHLKKKLNYTISPDIIFPGDDVVVSNKQVFPLQNKSQNNKNNADRESSFFENNQAPQKLPNQESLKQQSSSRGQPFSSSGSFEENPGFFRKMFGKWLGLSPLKSLKIKVHFGMNAVQMFEKKFMRNFVSTTKFIKLVFFSYLFGFLDII